MNFLALDELERESKTRRWRRENRKASKEHELASMAAGFVPLLGDLQDLSMAGQAMKEGRWGDLAIAASAAALPGISAPMLGAATRAVQGPLKRIYHGGYGGDELAVRDDGIFGGIFGSESRESAASHGAGDVFYADVPEESVLTQDALWRSTYTDDGPHRMDDIVRALKEEAPWIDDADIDDAYELVVEELDAPDVAARIWQESEMPVDLMMVDDELAKNSWFAQYLRGKVAQRLGYQAVEMADEHGTSLLALPGARFTREQQ